MLVHWLTAAPKSTTINFVTKEDLKINTIYNIIYRNIVPYLVIVVWIITIWVVGRVDITF